MAESKPSAGAGAAGVAGLVGVAGIAGKGLLLGGAVATTEVAAVSRIGSAVAREGALAGATVRTAEGLEHFGGATRFTNLQGTGASAARAGDDMLRGARGAGEELGVVAPIVEHPGALEGASGGEHSAHDALEHGMDLLDLGSNLIPDDEDDEDDDDGPTTPATTAEARVSARGALASDTYAHLTDRPMLLSTRPVLGPQTASSRFAALPGVRAVSTARAALDAIRDDRGHGLVVVYGARAPGSTSALRAQGEPWTAGALAAACAAQGRECVMLLCASPARCDDPAGWRAVGDIWGATLTLAAEPDVLTRARWLSRAPGLCPEVAAVVGAAGAAPYAEVRADEGTSAHPRQ